MQKNTFKPSLIAGAVCMALGSSLFSLDAAAEVVTVHFGPDTTSPMDLADPRANEGLLTILDPGGSELTNTSYPYYGDTTWGYGRRTQIAGTVSIDTDTRTGTASIMPFDFFGGGPAVFHDIVLSDGGTDPVSGHPLVIVNGYIDWAGSINMPLDVVWDVSGLFDAINAGIVIGDTITGGATPAANTIMKGRIPMGPSPIATTTWNVSSTGGLPLTDDGVGGSPFRDGAFLGFNVNIDARHLTVGDTANLLNIIIRSPNGTSQECSGHDGHLVALETDIISSNTDPVAAVAWTLDGSMVASGVSADIQVPFGTHTIGATVTTESGNTASDDQSIIIRDTARPVITSAFIDRRTGNEITSIEAKDAAIIQMQASDICDPAPAIMATAGFSVQSGDVIKAKKSREGRHGKEDHGSDAPSVSAIAFSGNPDEVNIRSVATDAAGNIAIGQKTLTIIGE